MNKRPHVLEHMTGWGIRCGAILAYCYLFLVMTIASPAIAFNPFLYLGLLLPAAFGGIVGMFLGIVDSIILHLLLSKISAPFAKDHIQARKKLVYPVIFFVPVIILSALILPFLSDAYDMLFSQKYVLLIGFPMLIAAITSTYAAHRYLNRLQLWCKSLDLRKSKAKNDTMQRVQEHDEHQLIIQEITVAEQATLVVHHGTGKITSSREVVSKRK